VEDGDQEGRFILDRLPTKPEAAAIPHYAMLVMRWPGTMA